MAYHKRPSTRLSDVHVAIDFGTTKICVVIGIVKNQNLEVIGVGKEPSQGIRKGVVVNIPSTVDAIQKAVEVAELMAGSDVTSVVVGIAGSHIRGFNSSGVVAVKDNEITHDDVDRSIDAAKAVAIPLDREIVHVIPQEFIVNDQTGVKDPLGMSALRLESRVHVVTAALSSAQNIVKCVQKAGLQTQAVILEPLASSDAVLTEDEKELGVGVIDIGGGTTDIALFTQGGVVHTGSIALGGQHITNDIAVGLRTSIGEAEHIKLNHGCALSSLVEEDEDIEIQTHTDITGRVISKKVLSRIIEPRIEEIFGLVSKEVSNSGYQHLLSSGLVITGGGSQLEGVKELAEKQFEMPIRKGLPINITGLNDVVSSPSFSTAIGLLRYATRYDKPLTPRNPSQKAFYTKTIDKVKTWLGEII